jgi:hypothetical protein
MATSGETPRVPTYAPGATGTPPGWWDGVSVDRDNTPDKRVELPPLPAGPALRDDGQPGPRARVGGYSSSSESRH